MILCAYYRGLASIETELIPGFMAAIGKPKNTFKKHLKKLINRKGLQRHQGLSPRRNRCRLPQLIRQLYTLRSFCDCERSSRKTEIRPSVRQNC